MIINTLSSDDWSMNDVQFKLPFEVGSEAHLIPKGLPEPDGLRGEIISLRPLVFEGKCLDTTQISPETEALIVFQEEDRLWRTRATVNAVTLSDGKLRCELKPISVWEIDQRRSTRYPVEVPVEIGLVSEILGEAEYRVVTGTAINMSLTGARVKIDSNIPPGAFLHVTFQSEPVLTIRALAITASGGHDEPHIGINFIEFIGDGQLHFHEFLGRLAA